MKNESKVTHRYFHLKDVSQDSAKHYKKWEWLTDPKFAGLKLVLKWWSSLALTRSKTSKSRFPMVFMQRGWVEGKKCLDSMVANEIDMVMTKKFILEVILTEKRISRFSRVSHSQLSHT